MLPPALSPTWPRACLLPLGASSIKTKTPAMPRVPRSSHLRHVHESETALLSMIGCLKIRLVTGVRLWPNTGEWVIIKYHSDQDELFLESGAVIVV